MATRQAIELSLNRMRDRKRDRNREKAEMRGNGVILQGENGARGGDCRVGAMGIICAETRFRCAEDAFLLQCYVLLAAPFHSLSFNFFFTFLSFSFLHFSFFFTFIFFKFFIFLLCKMNFFISFYTTLELDIILLYIMNETTQKMITSVINSKCLI